MRIRLHKLSGPEASGASHHSWGWGDGHRKICGKLQLLELALSRVGKVPQQHLKDPTILTRCQLFKEDLALGPVGETLHQGN